MEGKYFVVIKGGTSSGSFDVLVKDDNKTETDDKLTIKVVDVQGGEATYTETINAGSVDEVFTIPWAKDVPYEYYVGGIGRVLVAPANNCYTTIPGGAQYPLDASGLNNSWALKPNSPDYAAQGGLSTVGGDLKIVDDGNGPVVSILHDASTKVDWVAGAEAPTLTITMQDYCQEDVTVKVRLDISGQGDQTLTLTIPKGEYTHTFTADDINKAWVDAGGSPLTDADRKTFTVRITDTEKGETDHSDAIIRVVIHDGSQAIRLHDLESMTITEGWREGVAGNPGDAITLKMAIPGSDPSGNFPINGGIEFSVSVGNSSLLSSDTATLYTVSLTQNQLAYLQQSGATDYTVKIVMNGGIPAVEIHHPVTGLVTFPGPVGNPSVNSWGGTSLPAAVGDSELGDLHGVGMEISGAGSPGNQVPIYIDNNSIKHVAIQDGTFARLLVFMEDSPGVWKLVDGSTLSQLVQVTTRAPLEFDIEYGDYTTGVDRAATEGEDYTGSGKIRIEEGRSGGEFTITVTNDDITEGKEGLNLSLKATGETQGGAGHILDRIVDETGTPIGSGGVYGEADIIIEDDGSGPLIHWDISTNSVAENGEFTLSWESFTRGENGQAAGREIVAEDVTLEFEITPKGGFTLSEVDSITVTVMESDGPKTYTYLNPSPEFDALITDNGGTWTLKPTFIGGTKTLCVFTNDSVANCDGQISYTISGMTKAEVIGTIEISFGGTTMTLTQGFTSPPEPGKWHWNDTTKQIEILSKPGEIHDSYDVTITFAKEGGSVTAADLSNSKLNMDVENPEIVNREVGVTIKNETTLSELDGPKVSVSFAESAITEGSTLHGTVRVDLDGTLLEGTALLDNIVIVLKVSPSGATFTPDALSDIDPSWVSRVGDTVTITIPKTATNPGNGFDLDFTMDVPGNSTKDNPEYKVEIIKVHGENETKPVYEKYEKAPGNSEASITPTDTDSSNDPADKQGPVVGIAFDSGPFTEGGDITGTLSVALTHAAASEGTQTLDDIVITLNIAPPDATLR